MQVRVVFLSLWASALLLLNTGLAGCCGAQRSARENLQQVLDDNLADAVGAAERAREIAGQLRRDFSSMDEATRARNAVNYAAANNAYADVRLAMTRYVEQAKNHVDLSVNDRRALERRAAAVQRDLGTLQQLQQEIYRGRGPDGAGALPPLVIADLGARLVGGVINIVQEASTRDQARAAEMRRSAIARLDAMRLPAFDEVPLAPPPAMTWR